jgi:hypothetical protein
MPKAVRSATIAISVAVLSLALLFCVLGSFLALETQLAWLHDY